MSISTCLSRNEYIRSQICWPRLENRLLTSLWFSLRHFLLVAHFLWCSNLRMVQKIPCKRIPSSGRYFYLILLNTCKRFFIDFVSSALTHSFPLQLPFWMNHFFQWDPHLPSDVIGSKGHQHTQSCIHNTWLHLAYMLVSSTHQHGLNCMS